MFAVGRYRMIEFKRHDSVGSAAAEDDSQFLRNCFVDTGDLPVLLDIQNTKRILVGRTGAGKTALLSKITESNFKVISISPDTLSLNYIANSSVIQFFENSGVKLSPYYTLLWKHILVVEILKDRYQITNEDSARTALSSLREMIKKDNTREQAIDYLENWGSKFWLTSDVRLKEITTRIEKELSGSLKGKLKSIELTAAAAKSLTTEEKNEVVEFGKEAVSGVQIRELQNMLNIMDDVVFNNKQLQYFITIDCLDEEWADDRIRYNLIKALIDSIRQFQRVSAVKIVCTMRHDLLSKVLQTTQDKGFQAEKYNSLYLPVSWNAEQLKEIIKKRLNFLLSARYENREIELAEVFQGNIDGNVDPLNYIINRSHMRPRDVIEYVNECLKLAEGKSLITAGIIKQAEESYSIGRLEAICYEWNLVHPNLRMFIEMLSGQPNSFKLADFTIDDLSSKYEEAASGVELADDPFSINLKKLYSTNSNSQSVRSLFFRQLHLLGIVGIKRTATSSVRWGHDIGFSLMPESTELSGNAIIYIHPMFYRALDIKIQNKQGK